MLVQGKNAYKHSHSFKHSGNVTYLKFRYFSDKSIDNYTSLAQFILIIIHFLLFW